MLYPFKNTHATIKLIVDYIEKNCIDSCNKNYFNYITHKLKADIINYLFIYNVNFNDDITEMLYKSNDNVQIVKKLLEFKILT